jgi:hypothetical protein
VENVKGAVGENQRAAGFLQTFALGRHGTAAQYLGIWRPRSGCHDFLRARCFCFSVKYTRNFAQIKSCFASGPAAAGDEFFKTDQRQGQQKERAGRRANRLVGRKIGGKGNYSLRLFFVI